MDLEFEGRHVVVTGGSGALGSAVTRTLLDQGAVCHLPSRDAAGAGVAEASADRLHVIPGVDLTDERSVTRLYAEIPVPWASVNCAGGFAMAPLTESDTNLLQRMWQINTAACFLCCREAVRRMRATHAGGRIVNVAARVALEPATGSGMSAYAASKAAVAAFTVAIARELSGEGILVNAVAPTVLDTPANREAMPDADFSTWVDCAELSRLIAYLISPRNRATRGAVIPVNGGL